MSVGVQFSGVTAETDIRKAELVGGDAIGVTTYPDGMHMLPGPDSHAVNISVASDLADATPFNLKFVLAPYEGDYHAIRDMIDEIGTDCIDRIEIGHTEDPRLAAALRDRYGTGMQLTQVIQADEETRATDIDPFLEVIDSVQIYDLALLGSNGARRSWQKSRAIAEHARAAGKLVILSGGLTVHNVAEAVAAVRPDIVDTESVNRKFDVYNQKMMQDFVNAAV